MRTDPGVGALPCRVLPGAAVPPQDRGAPYRSSTRIIQGARNDDTDRISARRHWRPAILAVSVLCVLALALGAPPAWANFGPAGEFGVGTTEGHLGEPVSSVAVDDASGDVYVVAQQEDFVREFGPEGRFLEAWGWGVAKPSSAVEITEEEEYEKLAHEFQRCGPAGEPIHPKCNKAFSKYQPLSIASFNGEGAGEFLRPTGIAVDQATGDVYVLDENDGGNGRVGVVQVFNADGELIGGFGERGRGSFSTTPDLLHESEESGIAVDSSGDVYISDREEFSARLPEERVMVFKPVAGSEYKSYAYAGQGDDFVDRAFENGVRALAVDSAGDLYVDNPDSVIKFLAGSHTPACHFESSTDLRGMAVDPGSGEVFVYSEQTNKFHRLNSNCEQLPNEGEFPGLSGARGLELGGLAFDPGFVVEAGRPPGVLYAVKQPGLSFMFAQPPVFPPVVGSESVSDVDAVSASLRAGIDPEGYDTRYRFQYSLASTEDCSVEACAEVPLGGGDLGSADGIVDAAVTVSGLLPGTEYHYRVIASNYCNAAKPLEECVVDGPDRTFTTYPSMTSALPDGRVWEMVSPPFKDGADVFPPNRSVENEGCQGYCFPGSGDTSTPMRTLWMATRSCMRVGLSPRRASRRTKTSIMPFVRRAAGRRRI